jgi:hypothetical protein
MKALNWESQNRRDKMRSSGCEIAGGENYSPPVPAPGKSPYSFRGTFHELAEHVKATTTDGKWTRTPGIAQFHATDGAILNWMEKSGKIWFQGKYEPRSDLERALKFQLAGGLEASDWWLANKDGQAGSVTDRMSEP